MSTRAKSIHDEFSRIIPPESPWERRENTVTRSEKGVKFRISCSKGDERYSSVFAIDKGLIQNENEKKCDKLILLENKEHTSCVAYFVELKKGDNIDTAISQLESTLQNRIFSNCPFCQRNARIVTKRVPKIQPNSDAEKAKLRFRSKYKCTFKIVNPNHIEQIG